MTPPTTGDRTGAFRFADHDAAVEAEPLASKLSDEVGADLLRIAKENEYQKLILNLSSVDFISSAGLGKVIRLDREARARGGRVKLCGLHPYVREVFHITRLDRLVEIHDDLASALGSPW